MKKVSLSISVMSIVVGISTLCLCLGGGRELPTEGIGMSLGILGFPLTFLTYKLLDLTAPAGTGGHTPEFEAACVAVAFVIQWQLVALMLWAINRRRMVARSAASEGVR